MTNQVLNKIGVTRKGFDVYESFCFMLKTAVVIMAIAIIFLAFRKVYQTLKI